MVAIPYNSEDLFSTLKDMGILSDKILEDALLESQKNQVPLGDILLNKDVISESALGIIIADQLGISYVNLSETPIDNAALNVIPEEVARAQDAIAFKKDDTALYIASTNIHNTLFWELLKKKTNLELKIFFTTSRSLKQAFSAYSKKIGPVFEAIIKENIAKTNQINSNQQPPIIEIVNTIIKFADQRNASDIHIEPIDEETLVRFRIDGMLKDIIKLPISLNNQIVSRIKVMARLRTDEHSEPQDGKIVFDLDDKELDLRVSIAPITKGEKVVMRLLSEKARHFSLTDLGLSPSDLKKIEKAYSLSNGMVLSTGPTGSGKTTTLYAMIKLINTRDINIMTIEDPVEYEIDTINQMQVNVKANITFAKGLRSIVRQDPDVVLVGEIRDEETADIAVNSAMTGHLVLSSLHTNDAATTFPRLVDMGVEPYLIASTIKVVIAQRLVRKICPNCKMSHTIDVSTLHESIQRLVLPSTQITTYIGKGCSVCAKTGYRGRVGIFEVLELNDDIREAITSKKSTDIINQLAIKAGMSTMLEDGLRKVREGRTSLEEVLRVTSET